MGRRTYELRCWVQPRFAGVGATSDLLFSEGTSARLDLLGTRTLASGVVIISYQVASPTEHEGNPQ